MGTSLHGFCSYFGGEDHPHAYGDKYKVKYEAVKEEGSSPRVWGQGLSLYLYWLRPRIIPTRMGTRKTEQRYYWLVGDHPHAYGDKHPSPRKNLVLLGSSPRVWGQADLKNLATSERRIIPTRMGTSNK